MTSFRHVMTFFFFAAALSFQAAAQLTSDVVPRERLVPRAEQIKRDLETSRRRLGAFRLKPQFLVRELGYTDNVYGTEENKISDYTASVAAGTRFILPFGPKGYIRGGLLPEYTWSAEIPGQRFLGGTYDVSAIALLNRLTFGVTAGTTKRLAVPSSETEIRAIRDTGFAVVDAELDVSGHLSIFASAQGQQARFDSEGVQDSLISDVSILDRDETAVRAGIRYRVTSFLDFTVAGEQTESLFEQRSLDQDNTSQAVLLGIHYDRPRSYLNLTVGQRTGDPTNSSTFRPYDETVGSYFASIGGGGPVQLELFGHRAVTYGLFGEVPYFLENRNGVGAVARAGSRLRFRASAEVGTNDYENSPPIPPGNLQRIDDVNTYGGGFDVRLYRNVALTVFVSQSDLDSNLDAFDRSIVRVRTGITFTGDFPR